MRYVMKLYYDQSPSVFAGRQLYEHTEIEVVRLRNPTLNDDQCEVMLHRLRGSLFMLIVVDDDGKQIPEEQLAEFEADLMQLVDW